MLRDEFRITQLGKRLKILEAAKLQQSKEPKGKAKPNKKSHAPEPAPAPKAKTGIGFPCLHSGTTATTVATWSLPRPLLPSASELGQADHRFGLRDAQPKGQKRRGGGNGHTIFRE